MSKIILKIKEKRIYYKFTSQRMGPKMKSRQKEVKLNFFFHLNFTVIVPAGRQLCGALKSA